MNNKIKLAVAGAVLSAASVANAGIVIPAGDWTLDINGNVNAFMTRTNVDKNDSVTGSGLGLNEVSNNEDTGIGMNSGLLPASLGFTGTTQQNGIDVSFTISFQTVVSENSFHGDGSNGWQNSATNSSTLNRQAFLTFGDKSWGTVKIGKDLGIYASDAILNDMTLLGVGAGDTSQNTTFGGIGTGYQYAAWKGQISYTTPNMNGFQATIGLMHPNMFPTEQAEVIVTAAANSLAFTIDSVNQDRMGIEAKASYSWTGDIAGKVWASGASYDVTSGEAGSGVVVGEDTTVSAYDIGANITSGNLGLTGYYYGGSGNGITALGLSGLTTTTTVNSKIKKRDGDGGYVQATYVIPTGTKLGLAYGVSNLDKASGEADSALVDQQDRWTVGAYHPLTKHLNLVAEYSQIELEAHNDAKNEYDIMSVGAILFF